MISIVHLDTDPYVPACTCANRRVDTAPNVASKRSSRHLSQCTNNRFKTRVNGHCSVAGGDGYNRHIYPKGVCTSPFQSSTKVLNFH